MAAPQITCDKYGKTLQILFFAFVQSGKKNCKSEIILIYFIYVLNSKAMGVSAYGEYCLLQGRQK